MIIIYRFLKKKLKIAFNNISDLLKYLHQTVTKNSLNLNKEYSLLKIH